MYDTFNQEIILCFRDPEILQVLNIYRRNKQYCITEYMPNLGPNLSSVSEQEKEHSPVFDRRQNIS